MHYNRAHLDAVLSTEQGEDRRYGGMAPKPRGLWVTPLDSEDNWLAWCRAERFRLEQCTHPTEVVLRPDANVLRICGADDLRAFHHQYVQGDPGDLLYGWRVDWRIVASRHQGILIDPYVWGLRLDDEVRWYYPWDCASGCIWDASAIERLVPLPVIPMSELERACDADT